MSRQYQRRVSPKIKQEETIAQSYAQTQEFQEKIINYLKQNYTKRTNRKGKFNFSDNDKPKSPFLRYSLEDIAKWLQNPVANEDKLLTLSNYMYNVSPIYRSVIRYMALMPTYSYTVSPILRSFKVNKNKLQDEYFEVLHKLEKMNLKHEMIKCAITSYKEDWFYGYEIEGKDSYFILKLDPKYCKPSSEEDGIYNFSFDFTYFNSRKDLLNSYPLEFKRKYEEYLADKNENWIELDSLKSVCFKVNSEFHYALPYFSTMFPSIYDLEEYKALKKQRADNENFMLLHQYIPHDERNPDLNKFLIDLELAMQFHDMAEESLPDGIAVLTSPMEVEAVKTEKSKSDNDYVSEAYTDVYNNANVSEHLGNSSEKSTVGLNKSINVDESNVFALLRQMERWINRKLNNMNTEYDFKFEFLDITVFNYKEKMESYLKASQYGTPLKLEVSAALGLSPLQTIGKAILENEVLGLHELFIPMQSSHTQTNDGGRPSQGDNITDSTENGKVNESNEKKSENK